MATNKRVNRFEYNPATKELTVFLNGKIQYVFDMDAVAGGDEGGDSEALTRDIFNPLLVRMFNLGTSTPSTILIDGYVDSFKASTTLDTANASNYVYFNADSASYKGVRPSVSDNTLFLAKFFNSGSGDADYKYADIAMSNGATTNDQSASASGTALFDTTVKKFRCSFNMGTTTTRLQYGSGSLPAKWNVTTGDICGQTFIRFKSLPTNGVTYWIMGAQRSTTDYWYFGLRNNAGTYELRILGVVSSSTVIDQAVSITTPSTDTWYHVAFCRASGTLRFFLDGVKQGDDIAEATSWPYHNAMAFFLGSNSGLNINGDQYYEDPCVQASATYTANFTPATSELSAPRSSMTIASNGITVPTAPSTIKAVFLEQDLETITLNTDIKFWVSRDGGTTYTQMTVATLGIDDPTNTSSTYRLIAGEADVSGQPSGTSIKFKITTHNNKCAQVGGAMLAWE